MRIPENFFVQFIDVFHFKICRSWQSLQNLWSLERAHSRGDAEWGMKIFQILFFWQWWMNSRSDGKGTLVRKDTVIRGLTFSKQIHYAAVEGERETWYSAAVEIVLWGRAPLSRIFQSNFMAREDRRWLRNKKRWCEKWDHKCSYM